MLFKSRASTTSNPQRLDAGISRSRTSPMISAYPGPPEKGLSLNGEVRQRQLDFTGRGFVPDPVWAVGEGMLSVCFCRSPFQYR